MNLFVSIARFALAILIIACAVIGTLSPLSFQPVFIAWVLVVLGILFGGVLPLLFRYLAGNSSLGLHASISSSFGSLRQILDVVSYWMLGLAFFSQIASGTVQALTAIELPSTSPVLHDTPGMQGVYLFLAGGIAFIGARLVLRNGKRGLLWAALLGAATFSSTLYLRSLAIPEAGPIYGSVFALALIAGSITLNEPPLSHMNSLRSTRPVWSWALAFLIASALSIVFSPTPGQSLDAWLRWAVLVGLAFLLYIAVSSNSAQNFTPDEIQLHANAINSLTPVSIWKISAWSAVLIAGVLPILLAISKFINMAFVFDLPSALAYRLHPTEMGGANLIARSVLNVTPLGLALLAAFMHRRRFSRWLMAALILGSAFLLLYSQSWEGLFAWIISLVVYGVLVNWNQILRWWRQGFGGFWSRFGPIALAVLVLSSLGVALFRLSSTMNIYSYNGRLIHWQGAILAWINHPVFGGGLANEALYTPYADKVDLFAENQTLLDDALNALRINAGSSLKLHSHNLLLEVGAGAGFLGFVPFTGFLIVLIWSGLRTLRSSDGFLALGVAACLAGITGELAWGMLDVLWVTPPFLSFPVWALVGLLVAANLPGEGDRQTAIGERNDLQAVVSVKPNKWALIILNFALVLAAVLVILLPALASNFYAAGFLAFQEHRFADAASALQMAARNDPLEANYHAFLAKSRLQVKDIEGAQSAYERASALKQDFSPYLAQLGWLAWLRGDLDQAARYFEQAIASDPGEIWQEGLHANFGLLEAARGQPGRAKELFKHTIELHPDLAAGTYWLPVPANNNNVVSDETRNGFDLALDPVYSRGPSVELHKRILMHMGVSDMTVRNFDHHLPTDRPILLNEVLDLVEMDYRKARSSGDRDAWLLLAALAEASQQAGLVERAEQAYIEFQRYEPESAFGFRDLGILYHEQDQLADAQAMLEQAVETSPTDVYSRYHLASVYVDQGNLDKAQAELDHIVSQSQVTLFNSRLFSPEIYSLQAQVNEAKGEVDRAEETWTKLAHIRSAPEDFLTLAQAYQQQGKMEQAAENCLQAAEVLIQAGVRTLSPELQRIGQCLGLTLDNPPSSQGLNRIVEKEPFWGEILLGHIYFSQGKLQQALAAYQQASNLRPDEGGPNYFLGDTYQALGNPERAEAEYRQAVQINSVESLPLLALGRMQWRQGRHEDAPESFRLAVEKTPGWGEAHMALGNALLASGERSEASLQYQLALLLDGDTQDGLLYDFASHLAESEIEAPGPDYVHGDYFSLDEDQKRVLFMHPDASATYLIDLSGIQKRSGLDLTFDIAMSPESWTQEGDGVNFVVYIKSDQGTQKIFSYYIDPKHNPADRRWHPYRLDLSEYSGQVVTLIFETETGPAGDNRYDWAGWGEPRLVKP